MNRNMTTKDSMKTMNKKGKTFFILLIVLLLILGVAVVVIREKKNEVNYNKENTEETVENREGETLPVSDIEHSEKAVLPEYDVNGTYLYMYSVRDGQKWVADYKDSFEAKVEDANIISIIPKTDIFGNTAEPFNIYRKSGNEYFYQDAEKNILMYFWIDASKGVISFDEGDSIAYYQKGFEFKDNRDDLNSEGISIGNTGIQIAEDQIDEILEEAKREGFDKVYFYNNSQFDYNKQSDQGRSLLIILPIPKNGVFNTGAHILAVLNESTGCFEDISVFHFDGRYGVREGRTFGWSHDYVEMVDVESNTVNDNYCKSSVSLEAQIIKKLMKDKSGMEYESIEAESSMNGISENED